jgi:hypothetical protein
VERCAATMCALLLALAACSSHDPGHSAPKLTTKQAVHRLESTHLCTRKPRAIASSVGCYGTPAYVVVANIEIFAERKGVARARRRTFPTLCRMGARFHGLIVGSNFMAFSPDHTKRVAEVLDGKVIGPEHCPSARVGLSANLPALRPWCRELERVYQDEALTQQGPLVDDAVKLIDRLNTIMSTGAGVAKMREDASKGPTSAAIAVTGLHRGGLCNGHARTAIVAFG